MARAGLTFLAVIMTARLLNLEDFGLFSIFLAATMVGVEITGKSLDWGLIRFSSLYLDTFKQRAYQYLNAVFKIRIVCSLVLLTAGIGLADFIASHVFHKPEYRLPLVFACVGTVAMSLWWFTLAVTQIKQLFPLHGVLNLVHGLVRVGGVSLLFALNITTLEPMLFIYVGGVFLSLLFSFSVIPKNFLKVSKGGSEVLPEFLHFSKWVVAANLVGILQIQSGFFFLGYFKDSASVGIYSGAWNLASGLDIFVFSLITVFFPKISKFKDKKEFGGFIRQSLKFTAVFSICALPLFFYAEVVITTLFSDKFAGAGTVFQVLLAGAILGLPAQPISLILFSLNKPSVFAFIGLAVMVLTFAGHMILIPQFSVMGAAVVSSAMKVLQSSLILLVCYLFIKDPKKQIPVPEQAS